MRPNGKFELCGSKQKGYWRPHANRFVLVFDGFFDAQWTEPAESLRKAWPQNHAEGLVLSKGSGGSLVLPSWGAVEGPVIFRPMPKRSVAELLVTSNAEETSAASDEAFYALKDNLEALWPEVLHFVADPKRKVAQRSWAALMLAGLKNRAGVDSAARLILKLQEGSLRHALAVCAARNPTDTTGDLLLQANAKGLLQAADVAPALGRLKRRKDVPALIGWLSSKREYDRLESLNALTMLGATEALEPARKLASDPEESVQLASSGLVARLSPDPMERRAAISKLAGWLKSTAFLLPFAAVDALCMSEVPEALPHLVAILGSNMPAVNRRNTAMALGNLGDPRTVPALIEAKLRRDAPGSMVEESEVRRAAAEALVKIGKRKTKG
jgi:HEAT repeat protein